MSLNAWYSSCTTDLLAYQEQKQIGETNIKISKKTIGSPVLGHRTGFMSMLLAVSRIILVLKTNTFLLVWVGLLIIKDSCILSQVYLVARMMPDC